MPKPIGLANLGNTCYLNSCLQILFQIPELAQLKHNPANTVPSACLVDEWINLLNLSGGDFVSPTRFVQAVRGVAAHTGNARFNGYDQNDASEFLYFLLNGWHEACCRPVRMKISGTGTTEKDKLAILCYQTLKQTYEKEYSEIMHLFFGIATNKMIPGNSSADLFSLLHLPMANDVVSCLREYTNPSALEGGGSRQTLFWTMPKYLFIVLGRFSGDGRRWRKDGREVDIPLHIDMSEFVSSYNPAKYKYDLMGVILHMGSIHGGHYVSMVKSGEDWYSCNDTCVIKETGGFVPTSNVTRGAYVLAYKLG